MDIQTYQQALDFLYSYIDYSLQRTFTFSSAVFDLTRMNTILALLGDPHRKYKVVHVAGTKGKGSVSAMVAASLRAAGYRVGLYTSPHLIDYCERIDMQGRPITHARLVEMVCRIRPYVDQVPAITTFEITTALALWYFAEERADAAVVEVGLGGRLDATNVVEPLVSVITSLSYDHTRILGNTLAEIAREKAGIVKPGIPFVSAPQEGESLKVLRGVERERGSPMILVGRDWHFAPHRHDLEGQSFYIWPARDQAVIDDLLTKDGELTWTPARYRIPLLGYHQVVNAVTAYAALRQASERGLAVADEHIRDGLRSVCWPGRFQLLSRKPYVVVDSAHNRDSARRLRTALDDYFPTQRAILLFGASDDKDIDGMLDELVPRVARVVVTRSTHPRAAEPEALAALVRAHGRAAEIVPDPAEALERALDLVDEPDVLVTAGSLFVAAAVLAEWPAVKARRSQSRLPSSRAMWDDTEHHSSTDKEPPSEGVEYEWTRFS